MLSSAAMQKPQAPAAEALAAQYPDYSAERVLSDTGRFARETELNLFLDSHRKAGLPLCATESSWKNTRT